MFCVCVCVCVWVPYSSDTRTRGICTTRTGLSIILPPAGVLSLSYRFYYSTAILDRRIPRFNYLRFPRFFIGPHFSLTVMYSKSENTVHLPNPFPPISDFLLGGTVVEYIPGHAGPSYVLYDVHIFNFSNVLSSYSRVPRVSTIVRHGLVQ